MRQILVDELRREELVKIEDHLKRTTEPGPVAGIFWLPVPPDLWGASQQGHSECGPFYFAIEVQPTAVSFELLVRSQSNLHCSCIAYASPAQRDFLLRFMDRLLEAEQIRV